MDRGTEMARKQFLRVNNLTSSIQVGENKLILTFKQYTNTIQPNEVLQLIRKFQIIAALQNYKTIMAVAN